MSSLRKQTASPSYQSRQRHSQERISLIGNVLFLMILALGIRRLAFVESDVLDTISYGVSLERIITDGV